jgi:hypothetical protein
LLSLFLAPCFRVTGYHSCCGFLAHLSMPQHIDNCTPLYCTPCNTAHHVLCREWCYDDMNEDMLPLINLQDRVNLLSSPPRISAEIPRDFRLQAGRGRGCDEDWSQEKTSAIRDDMSTALKTAKENDYVRLLGQVSVVERRRAAKRVRVETGKGLRQMGVETNELREMLQSYLEWGLTVKLICNRPDIQRFGFQ